MSYVSGTLFEGADNFVVINKSLEYPAGPQRAARSPSPSRAPPLRAAAAAPSCPPRAPRPAVWEAPGPLGRTAPRSMPGVFCWNLRRTFMAILSVRAEFCQAQHSALADK